MIEHLIIHKIKNKKIKEKISCFNSFIHSYSYLVTDILTSLAHFNGSFVILEMTDRFYDSIL